MKTTQLQRNKRVSLLAMMFVIFGIISILAPARTLAAPAGSAPVIGYVNRSQVLSRYPGMADIASRIQAMRDAAQKDYDDQTKDLPAAEHQAYNDKIARQEAQRESELTKPVWDKLNAAIAAVVREKGLAVVLDSPAVVYGSIDITADVIAKVQQ